MKLQKLFLAGNRVTRLRRTAAVLDRLGGELLEVDLRSNPLTVGFYTPQEKDTRMVRSESYHSPPAINDNVEDDLARSVEAHRLPELDKAVDEASRQRLDEDTKLRRRVYEMLIMNACRKVQRLDGLEADRREVGRRDGVWERLVEVGVLREKERGMGGAGKGTGEDHFEVNGVGEGGV